jgi:Xaa-Pro aminopeptidase
MDQFAERRKRLMDRVGDGAVIVHSGRLSSRNHDVDYVFRPQSAFWYLTGFDEPDAVAVLRPGHEQPYALFVLPRDPRMETWTGLRAGVEGAKEKFGADVAFSAADIEKELPPLIAGTDRIFYALGMDAKLDRQIIDLTVTRRRMAPRGDKGIASIIDPIPLIDEMRLIKSAAEIESLRKAIDITAAGYSEAFKAARPGAMEYEVQAAMETEFRRLGSPRNGYPSIVASGAHACILHYISNRDQMKDGDLLLIDAGAEFDFYSADITRTWPVNGKFTPAQKDVYEVVLAANEAGIAVAKPGNAVTDVHDTALKSLVRGLIDLGALKGDVDEIIQKTQHLPYYMHGTSHWLGLDVHDSGIYRTGGRQGPGIKLEPGMVLTVEPGLYFGPFAEEAPERLKGIGVRIEDDVLITEDGNRVMTSAVPKTVAGIEAAVGSGFDGRLSSLQ